MYMGLAIYFFSPSIYKMKSSESKVLESKFISLNDISRF